MKTITVYPVTVAIFNPRNYTGKYYSKEDYFSTEFTDVDDSCFSLIKNRHYKKQRLLTKCRYSGGSRHNGELNTNVVSDLVLNGTPIAGPRFTLCDLKYFSDNYITLRLDTQNLDLPVEVFPVSIREDVIDGSEERAMLNAAKKTRRLLSLMRETNDQITALFKEATNKVVEFKMRYG